MLHYFTRWYTILHDVTLFYMMLHYLTLSYTILHYLTLLYTIIHYYTLLYTIISSSGRRVFDIATIRVSEIFIYHKNRLRVPTSCKHLCTIHFAKAWKFSILAQQITWCHNRNSNKSQLVNSRYSFLFCRKLRRNYPVICYFKKCRVCKSH